MQSILINGTVVHFIQKWCLTINMIYFGSCPPSCIFPKHNFSEISPFPYLDAKKESLLLGSHSQLYWLFLTLTESVLCLEVFFLLVSTVETDYNEPSWVVAFPPLHMSTETDTYSKIHSVFCWTKLKMLNNIRNNSHVCTLKTLILLMTLHHNT